MSETKVGCSFSLPKSLKKRLEEISHHQKRDMSEYVVEGLQMLFSTDKAIIEAEKQMQLVENFFKGILRGRLWKSKNGLITEYRHHKEEC